MTNADDDIKPDYEKRELLLKAFPALEAFPEIDLRALRILSDSLTPESMDERSAGYWGAGFRYVAQGKKAHVNRSYMELRDRDPEAFDAGAEFCDRILSQQENHDQAN